MHNRDVNTTHGTRKQRSNQRFVHQCPKLLQLYHFFQFLSQRTKRRFLLRLLERTRLCIRVDLWLAVKRERGLSRKENGPRKLKGGECFRNREGSGPESRNQRRLHVRIVRDECVGGVGSSIFGRSGCSRMPEKKTKVSERTNREDEVLRAYGVVNR